MLIDGFAARCRGGAADRIEYASTAIVVSGHKLADVRHPLDAFGLVVPAIEKRKILAVSFTSRKFPGRAPEGCVQLRTFVGGAMQPELMQLSDDDIKRAGAARAGRHPRRDLETRLHDRRPLDAVDAAISRRPSRPRRRHRAANWPRFPKLALAGNAYHGVGIPDSIHSGEQAAERIFASPP